MLDFTWEVFSETGNLDTYLLFKEIEAERLESADGSLEEPVAENFPIL
ncbi:YqzL family protein [Bacillus massiliglaciei]|nr:YqzL family protein [Bacillus massiliglaciei]